MRCLYFESHSTNDTQAEAKGSAGGLQIEEKEIDIEPVTWTERWDRRIRYTSLQVSYMARNS
jgi:COP9 signalosome complex subunit 4